MTATTSKLGADTMDQAQFDEWLTELAEPFWLKDAMKQGEFFDVNGFARALLARQPAAIDKQEAAVTRDDVEQAHDRILEQSKNSLFRSGVKICAGEILSPIEPCDKPPSGWTCSRTKGHEGPCAASLAAPSVEQDELGARIAAFKEWFKNAGIWNDAITERTWLAACDWMQARAASTSANVAQGAEAVGEIVNGLADSSIGCWYFKPYIGWQELGAGTKLYASAQSEGLRKDAVRREALEEIAQALTAAGEHSAYEIVYRALSQKDPQ